MTEPAADDLLAGYTDAALARPIPDDLRAAWGDLIAAVRDLQTIPDSALTRPWPWKGGSQEELRYGFYRIGEAFELAGIDADSAVRAGGHDRGRTADLIAPATAARWDLQGLLIGLPVETWDADPGAGEWTVRRTLGHLISSQRGYGIGSGWWIARSLRPDDPSLPPSTPDSLWVNLPEEETEGEGTPAQVRNRLDEVLDHATERLAGLPADKLALGGRWSGFVVDLGFRFGRWPSHIREHTIQVEKTLAMLEYRPSEVDRLVRLVLAAWGRAEAVVYGSAGDEGSVAILAEAAAGARATAADLVRTCRV